MIIKRYTLGMCQTNCYLLYDEITKEAIIIDPGCVSTQLDTEIEINNLTVKYIIFTHGHFDHIGGLEYYVSKYHNAIVSMHKCDVEAILSGVDVFYIDIDDKEILVKFVTLHNDGDELYIGNIRLQLILTPGHTNGGVCVYSDGVLFSGDTLFRRSIGRTDFIYGDYSVLEKSIKKLYELPDDTVVYPGHGDSTTILEEKTDNPFVRL